MAFEVGKHLLLNSSEKLSMKSEFMTLMKNVLKIGDNSSSRELLDSEKLCEYDSLIR